MKLKPLTFGRLYPAGKGLYFEFRVWRSIKELRAHCHWVKLHPQSLGLCSTYTNIAISKKGKTKTNPLMGEINVVKRKLSGEVLAHECTHAALGWARRKKINIFENDQEKRTGCMPRGCGEEQLCYAVGTMVNQAAWILRRAKIW